MQRQQDLVPNNPRQHPIRQMVIKAPMKIDALFTAMREPGSKHTDLGRTRLVKVAMHLRAQLGLNADLGKME